MNFINLLFVLALLSVCSAQPILSRGRDGRPRNVPPFSGLYRRRSRQRCQLFFRELDGTCTNNARVGDARVFGSTGRPQFSYFGAPNELSEFDGLPSPREISNVVFAQTRSILNSCGVAEIATFFGQFVDHTFAASPESEEELPIPPSSRPDEVGNEFLEEIGEESFPFARSERVEVKKGSSEERASNSLTSATDLVNVYGPSQMRNDELRTGSSPSSTRGELKVDSSFPGVGDLLPRNPRRFNNAPSTDPDLFLAGDTRANEHPVLAAMHTLFVREHNRLARELKSSRLYSRLPSDRIYEFAKRINEMQFQKILYEEWLPRFAGITLSPYRGFRPNVDVTLSLSFSTAAFRVGHTFVGPKVNFVDKGETTPNEDKSLTLFDAFFNAIGPIRDNGIDGFLRGSMLSQAQEVDTQVVDGLRNHLFRDVPELEGALDLISLNLQRGRDHGLPKYNDLREEFFRSRATCFTQISTDPDVVDRLQQVYDSPADVEAFVGLLAEDHIPGSSFGPTMAGLWKREFERLRDGDRFFFRNTRTIPPLLQFHPRVRAILRNRNFEVFRQILLDNTNITADELPQRMFLINGVRCGGPATRVPSGFLSSCSAR